MACFLGDDGEVYSSGDVGMGSGGQEHSCLSFLNTPGSSAPSCVQSLPPKAIHLPLEREGEDHFLFTALGPDPGLDQTQSIKESSWALTHVYLWG